MVESMKTMTSMSIALIKASRESQSNLAILSRTVLLSVLDRHYSQW